MPTSDKEVEKLQSSVEKKRVELERVKNARVEREAALSNEIVAAQLKAEEARLDAEIASEKQFSSASSVREGASATLDQAREEMRISVERQAAVEAAASAAKTEKES